MPQLNYFFQYINFVWGYALKFSYFVCIEPHLFFFSILRHWLVDENTGWVSGRLYIVECGRVWPCKWSRWGGWFTRSVKSLTEDLGWSATTAPLNWCVLWNILLESSIYVGPPQSQDRMAMKVIIPWIVKFPCTKMKCEEHEFWNMPIKVMQRYSSM